MLARVCNQQVCTAVALQQRAAVPAVRPSWVSRSHWITKHRCEALPGAAAAAAASAVALAFLPWTGCSEGGFYDTGVQGSHGKGCQAMYQPAAAAEERFAAQLRQQQQPLVPQQRVGAALLGESDSKRNTGTSSRDSSPGGAESSTSPRQQLPEAAREDGLMPGTQQLTASEQLQQMPEAAKDLVREILQEDNRARTKQLVDDAWQSLE